MSYLLFKHVHVTCVLLSGLGFALRSYGMAVEAAWMQHRLVRRLPHVLDSVLLGSALTMAVMSSQYPFVFDWLTAKFLALLAYILFGAMALRRAPTRAARLFFVVLAMLTYSYIVGVALTRHVWPLVA